MLALAVAAVLLACAAAEAAPRSTGRGWRAARYGRRGAEIWVEFPRFGFATASGYAGEYDIGPGLGFGFGGMFGINDNLAVEGMMLQTNHTAGDEERQWDLDVYLLGLRYTFLVRRPLQPFLAVGGARLSLERDTDFDIGDTEFERLTGFGGYASAGLDYIVSSSWSLFCRADYTLGGYGHAIVGAEEGDLDDTVKGDNAALSLGVSYRIPVW